MLYIPIHFLTFSHPAQLQLKLLVLHLIMYRVDTAKTVTTTTTRSIPHYKTLTNEKM